MEVGPNAPTVRFTLEAVPYFRDSIYVSLTYISLFVTVNTFCD